MTDIDTADHIHHTPSGATRVVAYVRGEKLVDCDGTLALLGDCTLVRKSSPDERLEILKYLAVSENDSRGRYARERLARMGEIA